MSRGAMHRMGLVVAGVLGIAAGTFVRTPPAVERASAPLSHEAYIWQRRWSPALEEGLEAASGHLSGLVVLAAEVAADSSPPRVARVRLDHDALRRCGRPVGLALRIGPFGGPFATDTEPAPTILDLATSLLDEAHSDGLEVAELQIDFDCATSKLDGYRVWARSLKARVTPVPLTITALPAWLESDGLPRLLEAVDGFVLQVHSLDRPSNVNAPLSLCDSRRARDWVESAARLGRPFRVALPTYGYLVAFRPDGSFLGLSAEGPRLQWSDGVTVRTLRADASDLAALVRDWSSSRPLHLERVIWYRLPTRDDTLNWRLETLEAVIDGRAPRPRLRVAARSTAPELLELDLVNDGEADASPRSSVLVSWRDARVVAGDALGGFAWEDTGPSSVRLRGTEALVLERLAPRERRAIGWIRFDTPTEAEVRVEHAR